MFQKERQIILAPARALLVSVTLAQPRQVE
jgi:hypothetical protein